MRFQAPTFTYKITEPGLAEASFTMGDSFADFSLPNVCNPLGDLLGGLVNMIINPIHLWGKQNSQRIVWYGNDEQFYWDLLMLDEGMISVKVSQVNDFFGDEAIELLSFECHLDEFLLPIIQSLDSLIKQMGLLNYHQQWQKDEFPFTFFLFLKKHLIDNGRWTRRNAQRKEILNNEMLILLA